MRRLGRIALLVLVVLIGGGFVVSRWILVPERLESYVFGPIEERTGVDIDVGDVRLGLDGILLDDVVVFGPPAAKDIESARAPAVLRVGEIAVRPEWHQLLRRRIVLSYAAFDGPRLSIHRDADGDTNVTRLVDALSTLEESPTPGPEPDDPTFTIQLSRLIVRDAAIELVDDHERPVRPLRATLDIEALRVTGLDGPEPPAFELTGKISVGDDVQSTIEATGTLAPSPFAIDADLALDEVDVDALVPNLVKPPDGVEPGPLPLDGIRVDARVRADRVRYEGFAFTNARAVAALDGTQLSAHEVYADIAGGSADVSADIDFGVRGFRYRGDVQLTHVELARAGGLLHGIEWGRHPEPRASMEVSLQMAGTTKERLLDTLALAARLEIDALDLDAVAGGDGHGKIGSYDTGDGHVTLSLEVGHLKADPFEFSKVRGAATLDERRLRVSELSAQVAGGSARITAEVDLAHPGLEYSGTVALTGARIQTLTAGLPDREWGTRTGVFGASADVRGANVNEFLSGLQVAGEISWTDGRVANSLYLREISDITGIPGFRDLVVMDSGGKFRLHEGVLSTERIRLWGPEAGIQASGTIDAEGDVDAEVALAIGPNSNRELFSTGIALPYVRGKHGWRFVPMKVSGNLQDPKMTIPPRAVLRSALTAVPDATAGVVSGGLGVVRGGTRALMDGTRALIPGSDTASDAAEQAVGESTGVLEGAVQGTADAVGSVFGGLFGDDEKDEKTDP